MKCLCGSNKSFSECCEPFLDQTQLPQSPEALMRSRYVAFCQKNWDYLLETTDPQGLLDFDHPENKAWMEQSTFLNLEVLNSNEEGNKGWVEFKAQYKIGDEEHTHHEKAKFRKLKGQWYFRP
ncbi:MAG: YchJ family protein [Bdellovibrionia bacterium]